MTALTTGGELYGSQDHQASRVAYWGVDLSSQERLTRGTVNSTMRRAAHPSECARCGAGAGCLAIICHSLSCPELGSREGSFHCPALSNEKTLIQPLYLSISRSYTLYIYVSLSISLSLYFSLYASLSMSLSIYISLSFSLSLSLCLSLLLSRAQSRW